MRVINIRRQQMQAYKIDEVENNKSMYQIQKKIWHEKKIYLNFSSSQNQQPNRTGEI